MATTMTKEDKKARKRERQKARRRIRDLETRHADVWYNKPIEDWDNEELARGRPRNGAGDFRGSAPKWVDRAVHEEAIRRFTGIAQDDLRAIVPDALKTIEKILHSKEVDDKGKPVVPPSVQLQAATWVVEHLVGKPTQRIEADISVKLQGILSNVMVSPDELTAGFKPAIDVASWTEDEEAPDEDDLS